MRVLVILLLVILGVGILVGGLTMPIWIPELKKKSKTARLKKIQNFAGMLPVDSFLVIKGANGYSASDTICYYVEDKFAPFKEEFEFYGFAGTLNNPNMDFDRIKMSTIKIPGEWITGDKVKIQWFDRKSLIEYVNKLNKI